MTRYCVFRATPTEEVWARIQDTGEWDRDKHRGARGNSYVEAETPEEAFRIVAEQLSASPHMLGAFFVVEEAALSFFYASSHVEHVTRLEASADVPREWRR